MRFHVALTMAVLACAALSTSAAATEYQFSWALPTPQGNALRGADFQDAATGWAVGDRGAVLVTTDGGASWVSRNLFPGFTIDLQDVLSLGSGELLAVGASPGVFRSADSGASWSPVTNPSTGTLNDLERVSSTILCAAGDDGQVLRSTDAGVTWTMLASPGAQDLHEQLWLDPSNGYVLGSFLARRTTNGGQTWLPLSGVPDNQIFNEVFFTDAQHGVILSDFAIWRTTNAGATWADEFPASNVVYMGNVALLSADHWFVVTNLEGASIFETTDGGHNWDVSLQAGGGGFLDIDLLPDGAMVAVSDEGDAFRSSDAGATWSNATHTAVTGLRGEIGAIGVGPSGQGAAGTDTSPPLHWFHTDDGGATWSEDPTGPQIAFTQAIEYWDADRAVVAGDYGQMWRTTNGGQNWLPVAIPNNPTNGRAFNLSVPAAGIAFAAVTGQTQSRVYRTTDYGVTWEQRSNGIPSSGGLTGISFVDENLGFASGYTGGSPRMFKTTDGGASWAAIGVTGLPSWTWQIHWHDSLVGLAAVYNSGGIYRTTNGGGSWTRVWSENAYDLAFSDALHGAATRDSWHHDGTIFVTEDGGATWDSIVLPSTTAGSCLYPVADGFWVGGGSAVIMKVTRIDPAAAGDPLSPGGDRGDIALRVRGTLGPKVEVEYSLPRPGALRCDVLDAQGRRVAVLEQGRGDGAVAGTIVWDGATGAGRRAPDGVYFIRFSTDRSAKAAKVVLSR